MFMSSVSSIFTDVYHSVFTGLGVKAKQTEIQRYL
jgi:hypothetical protein